MPQNTWLRCLSFFLISHTVISVSFAQWANALEESMIDQASCSEFNMTLTWHPPLTIQQTLLMMVVYLSHAVPLTAFQNPHCYAYIQLCSSEFTSQGLRLGSFFSTSCCIEMMFTCGEWQGQSLDTKNEHCTIWVDRLTLYLEMQKHRALWERWRSSVMQLFLHCLQEW